MAEGRDGAPGAVCHEALRAAPAPLAVLDRELRFLEANEALAALDGVPREAHLGRPVAEVIPSVPPALLAALRRVLDGGGPHDEEVASVDGPAELRRAWHVRLWPLPGPGGRPAAVAALVTDVTDHRQVERRERDARGRAERAADRLGLLNDVMAALSGARTTAEVAGIVFGHLARDLRTDAAALLRVLPDSREVELLHAHDDPAGERPERRATVERHWPAHDVVRTGHAAWLGTPPEIEAASPRPADGRAGAGGQARAALPLFVRGELVGVLEASWAAPQAFDAEERGHLGALAQQVAQALERTLVFQERERLLGLVGHDLRGPLTVIKATAEALRRPGVEPERVARGAERVLSAARRMERITSDLVDYTEVRVGRSLSVLRRPCDLAELVARVTEELDLAFPGRGVAVSQRGDGRGEWDAARVGQVLSNLLENAVRHGQPDRPVRLRWDGTGDEVLVAVENDGPGIPADLLPRVFEAFWRGAGARPDGTRGLGLGLFIAREIVRAHGGTMEARSEPGGPTAFSFRLPRRPPLAP